MAVTGSFRKRNIVHARKRRLKSTVENFQRTTGGALEIFNRKPLTEFLEA